MQRFETPNQGESFKSEYDIKSSEIADMISRSPVPLEVVTLNLDAAGSLNINRPGYGFALYGYKRSDNSKYPGAFVQIGINCDDVNSDPSKVFPAKTGRGFRGFFSRLAISWPTDPNGPGNSAQLIIFKSNEYPWIGGEEAT